MNEYSVHWVEGRIGKSANFQSLRAAISFKERKEIETNTNVTVVMKEVVPDDLEPYPDTRYNKNEFSAGNVVKFLDKLAIVSGSSATICNNSEPRWFDDYQLLFLSGESMAWINVDKLEFFAVGESYLINAWHRKYGLLDDSICLVDMIKEIGR